MRRRLKSKTAVDFARGAVKLVALPASGTPMKASRMRPRDNAFKLRTPQYSLAPATATLPP